MKKIIKRTLAVIGCILLVLVLALALHPLWLGSAVKCGAEKVGPKFTGTPIALANCDINLYGGRVAFDGFVLDNPAGASEKVAASVGAFKVVVDPSTVASDVIVVKEITIKDIFASYIDVNGTNNFDVIAANAAGPQAEEPSEAEAAPETETTAEAEEEKPAKKVVIEKLTISGVKVVLGGFPIVVPVDITLTDIGKESDGATLEEVCAKISEAVMKSAGAIGDALKSLGGAGMEALDGATDALKDAGANATEALKGATDSLKNVGEGAADSLKDAGAATTDALKNAGEATTDALKGATDSLKNVGEGAAESIKDLGKGLKSLF